MAPKQFRFESAWILNDSYKNMLQQCWNEEGDIVSNLQNVRRDVQEWKIHNFNQVIKKKKELVGRIAGIQRSMQAGNNSGGLRRLENKLQTELSVLLKQEELMWHQRSRARWLLDGDRNTKYYHLKTVQRRRKNNVTMLKDANGQWIEDVNQLQKLANEFYIKLFTEDNLVREWHQTPISYPLLTQDELQQLAAPITQEEVRSAVFNMHPWKAPGLGGFPAGFYQKS
jgi:hypothetical protein